MTKRTRLLLLLGAMLFTGVSKGSCAEASLYDPKTARKLSPEEISAFGPQSGRFRYDNRMLHAAQIAAGRARAHSTSRCWHYVKDALLAANIVPTRPKTEYAKEAGTELQ